MRSPLISTIALVLALAALATATSFTSAPAAAWNGREEARDGVTHILNPALPVAQPETITPAEAWRVGGDDEEDIIFGVLSSIAADSEGNSYLLDTQLSEVMVFSPDGEYIRSIGREGEGPGEFRRAGSLFFTTEGNVAVMIRIAANGSVISAKVLKSSGYPEFDSAARAAALKEQFLPATRGGDPVEYTLKYTYRFRIKDA